MIILFHVPPLLTIFTPGGVLHTNNYQVLSIVVLIILFTVFIFHITTTTDGTHNVRFVCRKATGELCCLRDL